MAIVQQQTVSTCLRPSFVPPKITTSCSKDFGDKQAIPVSLCRPWLLTGAFCPMQVWTHLPDSPCRWRQDGRQLHARCHAELQHPIPPSSDELHRKSRSSSSRVMFISPQRGHRFNACIFSIQDTFSQDLAVPRSLPDLLVASAKIPITMSSLTRIGIVAPRQPTNPDILGHREPRRTVTPHYIQPAPVPRNRSW